MAEAASLGRALDQPGDVGQHELVVLEPHDAEVGHERRERVVRDLRLRRAHRRDERGLPRVREPDERGVGHEAQLEAQPALLAVLALLGEARRPPGVREEPEVAPAAPPAADASQRSPCVDEVGEHLAGLEVADGRPFGHVDHEVARRSRRGAACPARGCRNRPAGGGGRGTRAATRRCGRPGARRRHPSRRRRRRVRPWACATPCGTTCSPRRRRHRGRSAALRRRSSTRLYCSSARMTKARRLGTLPSCSPPLALRLGYASSVRADAASRGRCRRACGRGGGRTSRRRRRWRTACRRRRGRRSRPGGSGCPLAHDDRARRDLGAAVDLDPEPLGRGIAPVAGGGRALLLRHGSALRDRR